MKTMNTRPKTPSDVAKYFGDDEITDYQARILNECGKSTKSYPFNRVVTNPNLLPCRHRLCPWCQKTRAQAWALGLRAVIDEEGDSGDENEVQLSPYWVELTLPGIPTAVPELRNFLDLMKEYLSLACNQAYWRYPSDSSVPTGTRSKPRSPCHAHLHAHCQYLEKANQEIRPDGKKGELGLDTSEKQGWLAGCGTALYPDGNGGGPGRSSSKGVGFD